jgi:hypothetical protein
MSPSKLPYLLILGALRLVAGATKNVRKARQKTDKDLYTVMIQPSAADNQRHNDEKEYWEKQIRVTKTLNWITAIGGVGALVGLIFLYGTLAASRDAAVAAKASAGIALSQLRLSERPWIGITDTEVFAPLVFSGEKSQVSIRFEMKNSGTSIANRVREIVVMTFGTYKQASEAEVSVCKINPPNEGVAYLMLPGQVKSRKMQFASADKADVDKAGLTQMWLSGCIFYFDQLQIPHRTPFMYVFVTREREGPFRPTGTINGILKEYPTDTAAD